MRIFIFISLFLIAGFAQATSSTADQIQQSATDFIQGYAKKQAKKGLAVSHDIGELDARLSLAPCDKSLSVSFSGQPLNTTQPSLLVSCEGERPWRMFLPVTLEIRGDGLVASRPLARGERITESALKRKSVVLNATRRAAITDAEQLIGMEMRRGVNTGTVLTPDLLTAPEAVQRGDHVVISAETNGFSVKSRGKALAGAAIGEQVLVENLATSRTVRARVDAPGKVSIPM